jgi:predicted amino acid racemase
MFLDLLLDRNPEFTLAAVESQQPGEVRANTYLFDLDTMRANAVAIRTEADRLGFSVYSMPKQPRLNPDACWAVIEGGLGSSAAARIHEMEALRNWRRKAMLR